MSNFGENLKRLRDRQNITISTLSDMTGIARRTIYDWEKGKYIPASFSSRKLLASIFHVSPFYFDDAGEEIKENPVIRDLLENVHTLNQRIDALEKKI